MEFNIFEQIACNPDILGGKTCIKGTRISVEFVLELVASGATRSEILNTYPHLSDMGCEQALWYAARFLKNDMVLSTGITS